MRHVQHLSLESLVKIDHFQKEPPLNSTGTTNRIRVAAERNCTMLDALALETKVRNAVQAAKTGERESARPVWASIKGLSHRRYVDAERRQRSPRPSLCFGHASTVILKRASRLSCGKPSESRVFTPIRESSGESRLHKPARET